MSDGARADVGRESATAELPSEDGLRPETVSQVLATRGLTTLSADPRDSGPEDVRTLLRGKLRVLTALSFAGFAGYTLVAAWDTWISHRHVLSYHLPNIGIHATMSLVMLAFLMAVWLGRSLTLGQLRLIELLFFGVFFTAYAGFLYFFFPIGLIARFTAAGTVGMMLSARALALLWFVLIVMYGVLIPNTGTRCGLVVSALAVGVVGVSAVCVAREPMAGRFKQAFLAETGFWMAMAAVIAIHGSHRISALRRAVLEARRLGQYRLNRRLGAGGMGEVYLAEHRLIRRPCALKLIRPELLGDPRLLARFEREVQVMARLAHWNIVELFDYGRSEHGLFYYVMEYLPGLNLQQIVERSGPQPPGRVVHLLRQVCSALREAHGQGLVHRDIKPGNLIVCGSHGGHDVVKLLDFGLARAFGTDAPSDSLSGEGTIIGSPHYMSPEQIRNRREVDGRSDVYSLGAVAYFLLTGTPPFVRDSVVETLAAHLREPAREPSELRPDVPADLQNVVMRCLNKEPTERFADVEALEQGLSACACAGQWSEAQALDWWRTWAKEEGCGNAVVPSPQAI